jgi:hypothetical protein
MTSRAAPWDFLGPAYTVASVCDLLGIDEEALNGLVERDELLQLRTADGLVIVPAFQIGVDGSLLPGLRDVIAELATGCDDEWTWAAWLTARDSARNGLTPYKLLAASKCEVVVRDACRTAWVLRP